MIRKFTQGCGCLFVVSAPSGAGKTSLVEAVIPKVRQKYWIEQVRTYTSKQPRATDIHRQDFYFVTNAEFELLIKNNFFLEWSNAHGAYYGTPRSVLNDLDEGNSYLLVIDRVGAEQVVRQFSRVVLIWIEVSTIQILRERLLLRGTESMDQIERRLQRAQIEMDLERTMPLYTHHVVNEHFDNALTGLFEIIIKTLDQTAKSGS